ncbi:MAG: AAA family ATPase [Thermacetogeniaceae bacterium]
MSKHIALAGKGGTGKTTLAALLVRYLVESKKGSILAVDADFNSTLNEALGIQVEDTISNILVDVKKNKVPTGMTKDVFIELKLHQALTETRDYDLLVMGGPQGPGCYCFPSEILKRHLDSLEQNYDYMVIDNEAGMEHISRETIENVDILLVVSDATAKGVRTASRIYDLAKTLKIPIGNAYLIITRIGDASPLESEIAASGLELLGTIPNDPVVAEYDLQGKALLDLPSESVAVSASKKLFEKLPF